jgi:hypothetical protein
MTQTHPELLTPSDVAERLSVMPGTLVDWRFRGVGPPYVKVGKLVRYPGDALAAWIESRTVKTTAA